MNYSTIRKLQKEYGYSGMQELIDNGSAWMMEGSTGRYAMQLIEDGACMLPKKSHRDYYGNYIPSRDELKSGTKGTYKNSVNYFKQIQHEEI
jgi:hypothetical protein